MYLLETVLAVSLLLLLIAQNVRSIELRGSIILFAVALGAFFGSLVLGQLRWQMLPAYLLLLMLGPLLLKRGYAHAALRGIGVASGVLLLASAAVLSLALPIVELPPPHGPYAVGSRYFSLVDESRDEAYFGLPDEPRALSLRVWYPGVLPESEPAPRVRTLWQDLYRGRMDRIAFLAGYMRGIETHTYPDIPLATAQAPFPVLIFSHAQGLFAEQNTLLMEHLASHGFVVIGVNHTRLSLRVVSLQQRVIAIDPQRQQEAGAEGDALDEETLTGLFSSPDPPQRLSADLAALAPALTEQLAIRIADLRFVMDSITAPPGGPRRTELLARLDPERIGLIGMSFGGTTVIQTCKVDRRCRAGLNLDGPLLGDQRWRSLEAPFLSLLSPWTQPYYQSVLRDSQGPYYEVLVEGAEHGDFFDMTLVLPRWLGTGGEIAPRRAVEVVNAAALRFFDAHLRNGPELRLDKEAFPELRLRMNAAGPADQASAAPAVRASSFAHAI